jgi:hypothetical protein
MSYDWEPGYGFCAYNLNANEDLARALEAVRRRVCAYGRGTRPGADTCDCKYGIDPANDRGMGSEQTGCPALTEVINRLLHRPETFGMGSDATQTWKERGYDLALDHVQHALDSLKQPYNFVRTL